MLKGLKGLFVVEEEQSELPKAEIKPVVMASSVRSMVMPIGGTPVVQTSQAVLPENGKMKEKLKEELLVKIEGTPYAMYLKIMEVMKTQIADPATRTVAVGASLAAQSVTKTQLLQAAQSNGVDFLNAELATFETEIGQNIADLQNSTDNEIAQLDEQIKSKREQQDQLAREIVELGQQKDAASSNLVQVKGKLELAKIEFNSAHKQLLTEVQGDIESITKYIIGA